MSRGSLIVLTIVMVGTLFVVRMTKAATLNTVPNLYQSGAPLDSDHDGLTDQGELQIFHTDPFNADTDGDGYSDGAEVMSGTDPLNANDPAAGLQPQVVSQSTHFPWAWVVTRAAGISSYILVFLLTITGMLMTTGMLFRAVSPAISWSIHRTIGLSLLISVALHLGGLMLDSFMNFRLTEIFVPFVAHYRGTWVSLGIFGFYLLLFILYWSVYQIQKKAGFWRFLHFFGFPMFILLFLHGIYTGSDSQQPLIKLMYWSTGLIVVFLSIYRLVWKARRRAVRPYGRG